MQTQIQQLRQQLNDRDQQLQQAQQAAAAAQAAATQAQQQAAQQSSVLTENTQAVSSLQGAVSDLKTNNVSLATTVQAEQAKVQKQMANPDCLHYKGATITPGGFMAAETVYRSAATGGGTQHAHDRHSVAKFGPGAILRVLRLGPSVACFSVGRRQDPRVHHATATSRLISSAPV